MQGDVCVGSALVHIEYDSAFAQHGQDMSLPGPATLMNSSGFRLGREVDEQASSLPLVSERVTLKTVSHGLALCYAETREKYHHKSR